MENKNKFLRMSTVLFVLNISASALNYICQLLMARVLSVEAFGTINTIFSFMMIVAVPGTTLTMIVAKYYAEETELINKQAYLKSQLRMVIYLTIIVFLCLFIFRNGLSKILSITDGYVLFMTFILAAFGFFQPLYSGVFSGNKCFVLVGIYSLMIPLYKLIAVGVSYIYTNSDTNRLYMLLVIMIIGVFVTALFGQCKSSKIVGRSVGKNIQKKFYYSAEEFRVLILNVSLMFYMNLDLLAIRYYGNEVESGLYSAVLLFGRIIYYFATTLGTILLPSVADKNIKEKDKKQTLNRSLVIMVGFSCLCIIPINMFKNVFIKILYGTNYLAASKYVVFVSFISLVLSVFTIMVNYAVGVGRTKHATRIMLIVDILLLISVILLKETFVILSVIGVIGLLGIIAIYATEFFDKVKE